MSNIPPSTSNIDDRVVEAFGEEWGHFTQAPLSLDDKEGGFRSYFSIFPWDSLPKSGGVGADIGCGSGRWASMVAPRVETLHALDASSQALTVAKRNLSSHSNIRFHNDSVHQMPFGNNSLDFAYSLGVLHHLPNTSQAIESIAQKLKYGAPLLIYLYYAFDNRPGWYKKLWQLSELFRGAISRCPFIFRLLISQFLAIVVYWPLASMAKMLESLNMLPKNWPLSYYRDKTLYTLRTDALDRFGTRLEHRFTRVEIEQMMLDAGFEEIKFSNLAPYWCAVGIKKHKKKIHETSGLKGLC
jgi:ubiquinone/menaquinone biosynthesis C-methylase UbiE